MTVSIIRAYSCQLFLHPHVNSVVETSVEFQLSSATASLSATFPRNAHKGLPVTSACIRALQSSHDKESSCFLIVRSGALLALTRLSKKACAAYVPCRPAIVDTCSL
jgi:hypothetical protein